PAGRPGRGSGRPRCPPGVSPVMRRRRSALGARRDWAAGAAARLINSQPGMALITPRADRVIDLIDLRRGQRYVDIGCGTAAYAHLLAARAGLAEPPLTLDLAADPAGADAVGLPDAT